MFKKFLNSTSGNFAVIAAIAMVPLMAGVGVAIDYGRGVDTKSEMQNALDGAVLAALGMPDSTTKSDRQKKLQSFYAANGGLGTATLETDLKTGATAATLAASSAYDMPTSVMGILGVTQVRVTTKSSAQKPVKLTTLSFKLEGVTGAWDKTVYLMARPVGGSSYSQVLRMVYVYPSMTARSGITTVSNKSGSKWVDTLRVDCTSKAAPCTRTVLSGDGTAQANLTNMDDVYLQMDITAVGGKAYWWFKEKTRYLMSNDPLTADQIFTAGKAAAKGDTISMVAAVGCDDKWVQQRWEDGGGWDGTPSPWEGTDFKYEVKGTCGTNGGKVRLTQ